MKTYDFDRIVDRHGTNAVKYDALTDVFGRKELLPLWVADMDFATPDFILDALRRRLDHPVLGYTQLPDDYWPQIAAWIEARHGWRPDPAWMRFIPGIVKGIGMAVLAGDALLNKAFETAAEAFSMIGEAADIAARYAAVAKALQILANKAGIYGMIGGQCADICAEELPSDQVTKELLWYIHKNKTAALIEAALMIGAVLAGASDEAVKKLEQAAENIGIAFQIQDDILDVTSSLEVLGKPVGSDEKNHKVTYVRLNGLEQSKKDVEALSEEALKILSSFDRRNEFLEDLVRALITREK